MKRFFRLDLGLLVAQLFFVWVLSIDIWYWSWGRQAYESLGAIEKLPALTTLIVFHHDGFAAAAALAFVALFGICAARENEGAPRGWSYVVLSTSLLLLVISVIAVAYAMQLQTMCRESIRWTHGERVLER